MNHLTLTASVIGRQALRYTPAGLPVLDLTLHHESEVVQEGQPRRVSVELRGRAVGSVVPAVERLDIGASRHFSGFIGAQRNGRGVVFHLLEVAVPSA
ncbi:MAG: primosomal replication protein N [Ideonella sp.]|nr:primosomal replication protein N [Ideonella sp.]